MTEIFDPYIYENCTDIQKIEYINNLTVESRIEFFQRLMDKIKGHEGEFVFCECRENASIRLFIYSLNEISRLGNKNGWWDFFTLSNVPCKKGIILCVIKEFKFDKNGYINLIVEPLRYIDGDIYVKKRNIGSTEDAWNTISQTSLLFNTYKEEYVKIIGNNSENLIKEIENRLNIFVSSNYKMLDKSNRDNESIRIGKEVITMKGFIDKLFLEYANGRIELIEIQNCLNVATEEQLYDEKVMRLIDSKDEEFMNKYPLSLGYYLSQSPYYYVSFSKRLREKASRFNSIFGYEEEPDLLEKTERVLKYEIEQSEKEKEEMEREKEVKKQKHKEDRKKRKEAEKAKKQS